MSLPSPPARVEADELGAGGVSPQVTALADFVNGFQPAGAISQTAHRTRSDRAPSATARELLAQLRAGGPQPRESADMPRPFQPLRPDAPVWHPIRDSMAAPSQAEKLVSALRMVEARQMSAPGWHPF